MKDRHHIVRVPDIPYEGLEVSFPLDVDSLESRANTPGVVLSDVSVKPPQLRITAPSEVSVTLTRESRTVHLRGDVRLQLSSVCSRCAEEARGDLSLQINIILKPRDEVEGDDAEDVGLAVYQNDLINCAQVVEDAVTVELPFSMLCKDDCLGRCMGCGKNLNETSCTCSQVASDEPVSPFSVLREKYSVKS